MRLSRAMVVVVLLFFSTPCTGDDRTQQGFDLGSMSYAGRDWGLVMDGGIKRGVAEGVSGSITSFFKQIFGPAIRKGAHVARICGNAMMNTLTGDRGFDVREPINYNYVLKRDMETLDNAAKGARVVRAHVLEQKEGHAVENEKKNPHSVAVLKQDVEYVIAALQKRLPYYEQKFNTEQGRVSKALDFMVVPAGAYLLKGVIGGGGNNRFMADVVSLNELLKNHRSLYNSNVFQVGPKYEIKSPDLTDQVPDLTDQVKATDGLLESQLELANERFESSIDVIRDTRDAAKNRSFVIFGKNVTEYAKYAKCVIAAYIAWRAIVWLRSERSAALAAALSDVDRDMVVQITKNVIGQLKHIVELCDEVKEDGDIVRLKDGFDFTSKNCSEGLLHIAQLIDHEEAIIVQSRGKPGQMPTGLNQSGGGLGARFS